MAGRRKLEEKIRKKEAEIQELEHKVREARAYVQALQDVLKMFPRESAATRAEAILRPGSTVARARELILKHGKPMHVSDILRGLSRPATREAKAALGGSIAAYVRKGQIFMKTGPNIFGLIEQSASADGEEPSPDFGVDEKREINFQ